VVLIRPIKAFKELPSYQSVNTKNQGSNDDGNHNQVFDFFYFAKKAFYRIGKYVTEGCERCGPNHGGNGVET